MKYKIEAVAEIDHEMANNEEVCLYISAAMENPKYPMRVPHCAITSLDDDEHEDWYKIHYEQQHDEAWELAVDVVRAIHLQGIDVQTIVDVILAAEGQKDECHQQFNN